MKKNIILLTIIFILSAIFVYGTTTFTLTSPADNDWTNDTTPAFTFTPLSDVNTSLYCELFIDDTSSAVNLTVQNDTSSELVAGSALSQGAHSWYINCTDTTTSKSPVRTLTVDTGDPSVTLNKPTSGQYLNSTSVDFNFSASDALDAVLNYTLFIDGSKDSEGSINNGSTVQPNTVLTEGEHNWSVHISDNASNFVGSSVITFNVDVTKPRLPASVNTSTNADGSVAVTWSPVTLDVQGNSEDSVTYWLFRTTDVSSLDTTKTTERLTTGSSTSYTDTGISTGTNYTYVVTTVDSAWNYNESKGAKDSIVPAECTTTYDYGSWGECDGGTRSRTGTRTCYTGDTSATQSESCSSGSSRRSTRNDVDTPKSPRATWQFQQVTPGAASVMKIYNEELGLKQIQINVSTVRQDVKITVEKLDGKPAEVTHEIDGRVYRYFSMEAVNIEEGDSGSKIQFRVAKTWLNQNDIAKENVVLMRYNDGWRELETEVLEESDSEILYEATTPGFSYFAVAEREVTEETQEEEQPPVEEEEQPVEDEQAPAEEEQQPEPEEEPEPEQGSNAVFWIVLVLAALVGFYVYYRNAMKE